MLKGAQLGYAIDMPRFQPTAALAAFILILAVLATQFAGLGQEVIDPDESTFILMGADVARGHLPFVEQFDLKPPMIFLLVGGVLATFGKSLIVVRLLGDFLLFGTAMLTFHLARRLATAGAALGGALVYVAFASLELGQSTYSELPALFFGMGALLVLVRTRISLPRAASAGLLVALAVLSRTNLYPVPIVLGFALLVAAWRGSNAVHPRAWLAFGLGGLVPVAALVMLYGLAGELAVLKLAMIEVPLAYSQQQGPLATLIDNARQFYFTAASAPLIVAPLVLLTSTGLFVVWQQRRDLDWPRTIPLLGLGGLVISLVLSGAVYPHYWLQVAPITAIFAALGLERVARLPMAEPLAIAAALAPIAAAAAERLPQAIAMIADPSATEARFEIAKAGRFITAIGGPRPVVWPWRKQLIDWYLDQPPLSKAGTQPENIARPEIIDPLVRANYIGPDEVGRLMQMKPDFVVTDAAGKGQTWMRGTGKPVDQWLARHYVLAAQFGDVLVYRRVS